MEELQARHRKEQRDLQSRMTQKKKQASKKTRKGVNDECDRLEAELKLQQADEIAALGRNAVDGPDVEIPTEQLQDLDLNIGGENGKFVSDGTLQTSDLSTKDALEDAASVQSRKPNRQKQRLARRAAEQEDLVRRAAAEAKDMPDMKQQERKRMLASMEEHGLQEKEIRADGHCLYSAVADQLDQLGVRLGTSPAETPIVGYQAVRSAAADYIEKHEEDFVPFLEEPLPDYLHKVKATGEWGGQLELMALAKTYGTNINVLQDYGRVEKIEAGGEEVQKTMWLGYYKHGFGLGEHYNSLRKAPT